MGTESVGKPARKWLETSGPLRKALSGLLLLLPHPYTIPAAKLFSVSENCKDFSDSSVFSHYSQSFLQKRANERH